MKILISDPLSEEGIELLRHHAQVDVKTELSPKELISIIGDYEALVVRSQTKVTAEVIQAGKKLQVIGRAGVGVDNINVDEATKRGIIVCNVPDYCMDEVSNEAMAMLLAASARGAPLLVLDMDIGDPRGYAEEQIRTRLEGFIELLDSRR